MRSFWEGYKGYHVPMRFSCQAQISATWNTPWTWVCQLFILVYTGPTWGRISIGVMSGLGFQAGISISNMIQNSWTSSQRSIQKETNKWALWGVNYSLTWWKWENSRGVALNLGFWLWITTLRPVPQVAKWWLLQVAAHPRQLLRACSGHRRNRRKRCHDSAGRFPPPAL